MRVLPWWAYTLAAALVAALTGAVVWWLLGEAGGDAKLRIEAIRTALTVGLGAGGAFALVIQARRQWLQEQAHLHAERTDAINQAHQERVAEAAERDATERRVTELYNAAATQLGSDQAPVRLTALYTLERLADANPGHRQTIVNIICAYLRMPYTPPAAPDPVDHQRRAARRYHAARTGTETGTPSAAARDPYEERQVRLTAQRILHTHLQPDATVHWAGIDLDLTGATLIDFTLAGCHLHTATFTQANFTGLAVFDRVKTSGDALFFEAKASDNLIFAEAKIGGDAAFTEAKIGGDAWFVEAEIGGHAWFAHAEIGGYAKFDKAKVGRFAMFDGVKVGSGALFDKAKVGGDVLFSGAVVGGDAAFGKAEIGGHARFGKVKISGDAWFDKGEIGWTAAFTEAEIGGDVWFVEAKVGGDAAFGNAEVSGDAAFTKAEIGGHAIFHEATVGGDAAFIGTKIGGDAWFTEATVDGHAMFTEATVDGDAMFAEAQTSGVMEVGGVLNLASLKVADRSRPHVLAPGWRIEPDEGGAGRVVAEAVPGA